MLSRFKVGLKGGSWKGAFFGSPKDQGVRIGRIQGSIFANEYLSDGELNHHVHIVGASGFGKTVLLTKIMRDQIRRGLGCLWLDMKGDRESIEEMIHFVKESGRENDLEIFSISDADISGHYNLVEEGNATEIRDKIIGAMVWTEEFYKAQAMSYLLKILTVLVWFRDHQGKRFDLHTVYLGVCSAKFIDELQATIPESERRLKGYLEECYKLLVDRANSANLMGFRSQLESLLLTDFGERLRYQPDEPGIENESKKKSVNLFHAVNSQKLVFIFLDSRRYGESARAVAKMIVKDLIATSARIDAEIPKAQRKPFVCFVDEFADIADESFMAFPDRARSSKMSLVLSHQDLSDLKKVSEEFYSRMTANMSTLYAFLQSVPESAESVASRGGTRTVWKETLKAERFWFFSYKTGDKSLREVEEFHVHPNVIKSLGVGCCVAIKKYPHARAHVVEVDEK